jgi:hypothetical protein
VKKDLAVSKPYAFAAAILLLLLAHCGGGSSASAPPAPALVTATALAYADPTTGTFQLRKNVALSTPASHLVLELWGPANLYGCGVTAALTLDSYRTSWSNVNPGDPPGTCVANGTVFALGAGVPILKAKGVGGALWATVAEKGLGSPKALNGPLLRFALDFNAGQGTTAGTVIALTADSHGQVLLGDGSLAAITVAVGTLTAQ